MPTMAFPINSHELNNGDPRLASRARALVATHRYRLVGRNYFSAYSIVGFKTMYRDYLPHAIGAGSLRAREILFTNFLVYYTSLI